MLAQFNDNFQPKADGPLAQIKKRRLKKPLFVFLGFIFAVVIFLIIGLFWVNSVIASPNSNSEEKKLVKIEEGQGTQEIAKNLEGAGVIKSDFIFVLYLKYQKMAAGIQAGEYEIPQNLTMIQLAEMITKGKTASTKITIPEGWTIKQIAEYLEKNKVVSKDDFLAEIKKKFDYNFLADKPADANLEGFLYPETYLLSVKPNSEEIVNKMLEEFGKKLTPALRDKIKASNMSTYEVVTLASVVEREVANVDDRKTVAGIFLNRLNAGLPLESCATIQYILGENKKQFTYEETRTPSPYNTYINPGLPKGPIGNPSVESIEAVLFAQKTDYNYFLTGNDGKTYFSVTLDEHNEKKAKYLQ